MSVGDYRTYWLPCPECEVNGPVETDSIGRAGVLCPRHGFYPFVRRPPTQDETHEYHHKGRPLGSMLNRQDMIERAERGEFPEPPV